MGSYDNARGSWEHLKELGISMLGDDGSPLLSRPQFTHLKQQGSTGMIISMFPMLISWHLGTQAKTLLPINIPK